MKQLNTILNSLPQGIAGISKYNLFKEFFLSGIIAFIIAVFILIFSWFAGGSLGDLLISIIPWVGERLGSSGTWIGRVLSLVVGFIIFKYILLIATGPLMSKISERIEKTYAPNLERLHLNLGQSINRGIRMSLRNLFFEIILTILITLLTFIPFVNIISIPLLFIVQSYYAGAGTMDFTLERYYKLNGSVRFNRRNALQSIAYGAIYLVLLMIPILGLFISPVLSTSIATHGVLDTLKEEQIR